MPPVVAFLTTVGTFVTAGVAVGSAAAVIGTLVVASAVMTAAMLMGKVDMGVADTDRVRQTTVRGTIEPRKLVYGETMISGVVSFAQVNGANNKNLHQVIAIAGHKLTSIDKIFFDDYSINLSTQVDASGDVTSGKFAKKTNEDGVLETMVHIETRDGSSTQTAYSDLVTAFAGTGVNAGKGYESTHRGDNVASIYTRWTLHEGSVETWDEVGGIQNIKAVVKGKAVYDPRLDVAAGNAAGANPTTAAYITYSNGSTTATHQRDLQGQNPALILADYLMDSTFGLGLPSTKIDWTAVITAADACDFLVPIPTSQTQKRFFGSGVIFGSDNHRKSISKILSGMNGDLIYSQGKYIIKAGVHEAASLAFTEDDLAGDFTVKTSIPRADRFNTIKGMFIDPDSNYKMTEFAPRTVSGAVARDNGEVLEEEIKLTFTSNRYVAQRIAIKQVHQSFLQTTLMLPVNLKGMKVAVGDRITLALNDFATISSDWNPNKEFKVIGWSFSESGSGAIELSLIEDDSSRYADPAEGDYNQISNTGVITSSLADVPLPTSFTATAGYNSVNLAWTNPTDIGAWEQIWIYASDTTTPPTTPIEKFRGTSFTHQIAGGTTKYYWIQAVKYPLGATPASGSTNTAKSALVPFGSPTAVTALKIANAVMADDSIDTDQIVTDAVGSAEIAQTLESDNWSTSSGAAGWQINKSGSATFQTVTIKGGITATSGTIGGTTITSTNLNQYSGSGAASHGDANTDFWLDSSGNFSLKDKFVWTGGTTNTLVIDGSGTFSGAVNASSGAFTGDVSTDSKFIAGSGATSATMDGGDQNYKFYAGAASAGASPFKVDAQGTVTADRIIITRPNDPSAVIFDSSQDGLVGIGLSSLSSETDNAVAEVADELTSNTDYTRLIISTTQTITIKTLFPLGYLPFAINSEEDFPDSITLQLQVASVTNGVPGTFNNVASGSKTFTRRVFSSGAASDDDYYSVYNSGNGWYVKGKDAVDGQFNLVYSRAGVFTPGDVAYRVQVSFVAGSGSGSGNPDTSSSRTLYYTSSTQYFTVDSSGIIRDQAPGSILTGDVILSAASGVRSISWRDSDTQDETFTIEAKPDINESGSNTMFIKYNNGSTSPFAFVGDVGNLLITGDFYTGLGAITANTASIGGGYGSTGLSIASDGNLSTDGSVIIGGDLTVSGTTTTVNTDNLTVKDPNITLNYSTGDSSSTANNAGITIQDAVSSTSDASILWKTASDTFEFSHGLVAPTIVSGDIDIGDGTAREELKIKSNSYAEIHYFIKHANNSNVLTEYIRAGVSLTESTYNQVIGDYFLFSVPSSKMLLTVPQNGDPLRRNNGAITIIDSTNYGTYALPLTGGTLSGNLLTTGTLQFDIGTGTDKSNIIQAANFPSEGYTASTQKFWLEYKTKGGHHFVVNTDGGSTDSENDFDHFTIWQGAIDGMQLFRLTNTGNATLRQKLTSTGLVSSTTNSNYQTGTPAAIFKDTTNRGTVRIRSDADNAAELFFDVNGAIAWDISARGSGSSYDLHFYGRSNNPDLTSVGGPFFKITQTGFADASAGFKVNTTTVIDSSRNLTAANGNFSGIVGVNKATNSAVGLSVGSDASTTTSYGLEVCNSTSNTRFIVDGLGNSTFYQSDDSVGMSVTSDGNVDINSGALKMGGTTIIDSSKNLSNLGSVTASGAITTSSIVSANTRIELQGGGAWAYTRLKNSTNVMWDLAANPTDLSGAFQFRPFGGNSNRTYMDTSGNWTINGTLSATGSVTSGGTVTSTLQGNNFVMDGHADARGLVMTPDSSTTYPVFLKSLNATGGGEASPWIYREQVENWGVFHNNPINTLDFARGDSGGSYTLIGTDVGGGNNEVTHRFDMANGNVYHHGNAYIGESLFFGVSGASSFIARESTVNLGLYADGTHKFYTYNGGWGERVNINDGQLAVYGSILQQHTDNSYLRIEADLAKEQMVRFKNSLTNYWYAGLRISNGLATTADFHIYSGAYANDVFALKTDGSMVVAKGATFNAETYVRDASNAGIRMQTTALGTGSSDGLRVGINSIEAFVWNFEALPLTFATSGQARFQISSTGAANFYTNEITSGNLVSSGFLNVASTASSRFGGDTFSGSVGMYDNASNGYQTPVLIIRKDFSGTGALNTAPVGLFMHNGSGKWVVLSMGARETNSGGNTVSIAGIASERTSGTVNAWATGNLHLWTKNTSTKVTNMVLKSSGDSEIPSGNFYVNGSILGKGIRAGGRGELHLNGGGTGDVAEIFFGFGNGFPGNDNNIRWGISDRGTTGTQAGLLNFYKGPALSGFVAVATLNANDNTFTVVNGYKVNGTTVIDGSRNIEAVNVQSTGGINLRRDLGQATGISFYSPTYKNWQIYMSPAGTTGAGANVNLTAPTGLAGVTSWALRSRMEGVSTYGWIWETGSSGGGGATATAKMSLQATTGNLQIAGSFTAGANITAYSDERLKDNIKTLDGSRVLEMRGVSFTKDGKAGSGVIAQELERIAPELVEDDGTFKSVAYGNLVGYLIENAKQQQNEIDELKDLVKKLMEK